jgi:hypothetical protein
MFFKTLVQRKFIGNENLYWDRITGITVLRSMILQHNEKRYKLDLMFGKVPAKCDNYFPGCRCCLILSTNGMKSDLLLSALLYLFLNKLVTCTAFSENGFCQTCNFVSCMQYCFSF